MTAHANPHPLQNSKVDQKNPMKIVFHLISYNPKSFPKNLFSTRLKPTEIYKSHTVFIPKCIATTLIRGWCMNCPLKFVLKSVIITAFSRCQNFVLNFFHFLFPHFLLQSVFNYFENWRSASQNKKTLQVYVFKSHKTCNSQTKSW